MKISELDDLIPPDPDEEILAYNDDDGKFYEIQDVGMKDGKHVIYIKESE